MYHLVVRSKLRRAFRDINMGAYERIVPQFATTHRHAMYGRHALAGERRTLRSTALWYERLKRLLPDLRFDVHRIAVTGWPWDTTATVDWTDHFTLPDGSHGSNQGVHVFGLRWGKVHSLAIHCDTSKLQGYCDHMARLGVKEALADPIQDPPDAA